MLFQSNSYSCSDSDYESSTTTVSDTEFVEERLRQTSHPSQVSPPTQANLRLLFKSPIPTSFQTSQNSPNINLVNRNT